MTEAERHLYEDDENSTNRQQAYQINTHESNTSYANGKENRKNPKFSKRQQYLWINRLCFFCGSPDHMKQGCLKWKEFKIKKEQGNNTQEIVLHSNKSHIEKSDMARVENTGQKKISRCRYSNCKQFK